MITIPAPTIVVAREEWPDADFDLPDGDLVSPFSQTGSDKDEEDWDVEMDLGETGGAKAKAVVQGIVARAGGGPKAMVTIRPPIICADETLSPDGDDDDEGISTIKVSALPIFPDKPAVTLSPTVDDDFEDAFALPSELTQLSLRPYSLNHRASKNSLEWGDREHTSSSTSSSDTYSSLGFGVEPSSSNSTTSASLPGTDNDEDDEDDDLDGLVIPTGLFESDQGRKQLTRILDMKKKLPRVDEHVKIASPDPEDNFEIGLVIDDDVDFSPSRLIQSVQQQSKRVGTLTTRSKSAPTRPTPAMRPPSRLKIERPKTPVSNATLHRTQSRTSLVSPPLTTRPPLPSRSQTTQAPSTAQPSSTSFFSKATSLRGQKSHSGLKAPSPSSTTSRKLSRKASLPSLVEASHHAQASGSSVASGSALPETHGYNAPTAASRARMHANSTSRMHSLEPALPPSRPSTPSSNPVALRLTMPTTTKTKSRTPISNVFPSSSSSKSHSPSSSKSISPPPSRSPPRVPTLRHIPSQSLIAAVPKLLRRTKRKTYGDGTELDAIDDLPTDRDKEAKFRVQPKPIQNRVPGGTFSKPEKDTSKGTIRKKREATTGSMDPPSQPSTAFLSLRHKQSRIDPSNLDSQIRRKKPSSQPGTNQTKRKPTLIRNLGGASAPKVVGEMKWNPQTLRWEGNDHVLRDFDAAVGTSTRPALITQLTGSSMGSPVGSFGSAARIVGSMIFDPVRMCWMSTLPPEDEEPDVFADMADDEEDEGAWTAKGGTIRASQSNVAALAGANTSGSSSTSSRLRTPSPTLSRHRPSLSESGSDRGSRASMICDVDNEFFDACRLAETRHRAEMKGWTSVSGNSTSAPDRTSLYDIRALATRNY